MNLFHWTDYSQQKCKFWSYSYANYCCSHEALFVGIKHSEWQNPKRWIKLAKDRRHIAVVICLAIFRNVCTLKVEQAEIMLRETFIERASETKSNSDYGRTNRFMVENVDSSSFGKFGRPCWRFRTGGLNWNRIWLQRQHGPLNVLSFSWDLFQTHKIGLCFVQGSSTKVGQYICEGLLLAVFIA